MEFCTKLSKNTCSHYLQLTYCDRQVARHTMASGCQVDEGQALLVFFDDVSRSEYPSSDQVLFLAVGSDF